MKHHILVKYNETVTDKAALLKQIGALYEKAKDIPGIRGVTLLPNCVDRPNRYDLMIVLDMDREALTAWDESEVHRQWKSRFGGCLSAKAIFDCE